MDRRTQNMGNPAWVPGVSGNPGGRPKRKLWTAAILAEGEKIVDDSLGITRLQAAAKACYDAAIEGDVSAMKEIGERHDGKVPQQNILMGDEDGGAVKYQRVERVIVDAANVANSNGASVPGLPATRAV